MSLAHTEHLVILPVLLPLLCGASMIPLDSGRHGLKLVLSLGAALALLAIAAATMFLADSGHWPHGIGVYLAANWVAPIPWGQ